MLFIARPPHTGGRFWWGTAFSGRCRPAGRSFLPFSFYSLRSFRKGVDPPVFKSRASRYGWFVAGVLLNSFGVALITKAALGTSPISSLPYVLSFRFPVTLGQFSFVMNMVFILVQVLLLRRQFQPLQFLQIAVNAVFSFSIDVSMGLLSWLEPDALPLQLLALAAGCAVLAFGISIEVAPKVLMVPGEGVVQAIAAVSGWRFGSVKVCFDATLVATALVLSLLFSHRLQGLGVGTILSALAVGRIVNLYNRRLPLISRISALAA